MCVCVIMCVCAWRTTGLDKSSSIRRRWSQVGLDSVSHTCMSALARWMIFNQIFLLEKKRGRTYFQYWKYTSNTLYTFSKYIYMCTYIYNQQQRKKKIIQIELHIQKKENRTTSSTHTFSWEVPVTLWNKK